MRDDPRSAEVRFRSSFILPPSSLLFSESPRAARKRHPQPGREHEIGNQREPDRDDRHDPRLLALNDPQEKYQERQHRNPIAKALESEGAEGARAQYDDGARKLRPSRLGKPEALSAR